VRWSYNIHQDGNQTSFHGNPLITDSSILIGTDKSCSSDGIGHVYAFDRGTGAVRWKYRTVGTPTDIVRLGSTIYAASLADELIALNLADGRLLWKFQTGVSNQDCVLPSAPVVAGEHVAYAGLDGILYGLDAHSGELLWKHNLANRVTTNLGVVGGSLYLGNSTRRLFRISAEDGHLESELTVPAAPAGRVLVDESALYFFLEDSDRHTGYLISTDLNLSHVNWMYKADQSWSSEWPRLWNGLLLAGNCYSKLEALRTSDGALQWSDTLKGCLRSIGTDGDSRQIYIGVQEGTVYAYSPPPSPR
jgi:hypothetical protein